MRLLVLPCGFALLFTAEIARADDCPPGAVQRQQDGYAFCEPTVCQADGQCNPNEVCRPIPLCMQVGKLPSDAATLADAGPRLVVTQRCAPDKTCPQTTVCSDLGRCISKDAAAKMGILTPAAPTTPAGEKKSCGCEIVGRAPWGAWEALGALGIVAMLARRRRARR